jgi:hypothetical protein
MEICMIGFRIGQLLSYLYANRADHGVVSTENVRVNFKTDVTTPRPPKF